MVIPGGVPYAEPASRKVPSHTMTHAGLHLFLGSDRARKLQRLQTLERELSVSPFDRHQVDASTLTPAQLLALCRHQPAASRLRLVVVDQAQRLDGTCVKVLLAQAEVIARTTCLVLLVDIELNARHALTQAQQRMRVEQFPDRDAPAVKPFALTEALGNRDMAGALLAVQEQLLAGKDPLEVLGLVTWQVQRWLIVKRLLAASYSIEQIVSLTGLRQWQAQRLQSEVVGWSLASLQRMVERCWRLDVDTRSGRARTEVGIEHLVMELLLESNSRQVMTAPIASR